ncbi:hypothetical protein N7495_002264 [Penicillium taxi]|uniref:uncharacterized protein n=1 Tax=Penicillium taxi TaxID=168475 RepID=UPI0025454A19|nr:uncharacterized protein N7495_002264 [Penicillium taxi]KAJ5901736.1 hypothetical protein N7495_002264 [Penicillium taxi]
MGNSVAMEADDRKGAFYKDTNIQSSGGSVHLGNSYENMNNQYGNNQYGNNHYGNNQYGDNKNHYGDINNHYGDNKNHYGDNKNHYGDNKNHYGDNKNHYGDNHYSNTYYASPGPSQPEISQRTGNGSRRLSYQQARPEAQQAQQPSAARGAKRGPSKPEEHRVVEVKIFGPAGYIVRFNKQSKIRAVLEPEKIKLYNMPRTDLQALGDRVPKEERPLKGTFSGHIVLANGSAVRLENVTKSSTLNGCTVLVGGNLAGTS